MSKSGKVLKTHTILNNSHNKSSRQLQFTSEVTLIGAHIVSKLQPIPPIIYKVINNFVHGNFFQDHFLSRPLCCKLYQNSAILGTSFKTIAFSLILVQWQQDSSSSNHHWHSDDQQTAFEEWKGHITLMLEASNIPKERWYASIIGFLGQEGFRQWQHLDILKDNNKKKDPNEVFKVFTETLEVSMSHWNHTNDMYSDIRQGEHEWQTS